MKVYNHYGKLFIYSGKTREPQKDEWYLGIGKKLPKQADGYGTSHENNHKRKILTQIATLDIDWDEKNSKFNLTFGG